MACNMILPGLLMVVLVNVLSASAARPKLCTPEQWEGSHIRYSGYTRDGRFGKLREHVKMFYDAETMRRAQYISYVNGDYEDQFQIVEIYDDKGGIQYMADIKRGACYTKISKDLFKPYCIPDDSKPVDSYNLGLKSAGLAVSTYLMNRKHAELHIVVTKAGDNVIPLAEIMAGYDMETGSEYFETGHFGDIAAGISNTTVFDVPNECKKELELSAIEHLMRRKHNMFFN